MDILFLDTETTGKDNGRLVQLAIKKPGSACDNFMFKPAEPICFEAMAVHHITNEMVENNKTIEEEPGLKASLQKMFSDYVIVAHNAKFDIGVLNREGFETAQFIDTLRVAQHVIEAPSYQLQYLRYFLGLKFDQPINPHNAESDVLVLEKLFFRLIDSVGGITKMELAVMGPEDTKDRVLSEMIRLTNTPVLMKMIPFGKYKDREFAEIAKVDRGYFQWLIGQQDLSEDLQYTLRHYLGQQSV